MSGSQLMVLVSVVVGTCAVLAASGFRGRQTVVGVDLGTTYSVIGVNEGGKVTIIPGPDGNTLVPSVVSFLDDGLVEVGHDAIPFLESDPASTIYGAKRFIGRAFSDDAVSEEAAEHQFKLIRTQGDLSEAFFELKCSGHPDAVSPQTVGSHVLRHLLKWAADYLGHKQVNKAVIAVPAKFDQRQRGATVEAFRLAGLQVIRTLEEPTAAALAFGLHRKSNVNHILVYDLGGGTLDVSLLFVNDGSVEVIGSDGDDNLGGSDFDQCVAHVLADKLQGSLVTLEDAADALPCHFDTPTCALHNLYPLSEATRRQLTDSETSRVTCMSFLDDRSHSRQRRSLRSETADTKPEESAGGDGLGTAAEANGSQRGRAENCGLWEPLDLELTRTEYEQQCELLFNRGLAPVSRLLDRLDLTPDDVDEVVMVGGMTRTPRVRELLKEHLRVDRLNVEIDPDIVVAYGAATVAH